MWAPYRVLRIKRAAYRAAQEAANLGPVIGYQARPHITQLSSDPPPALCWVCSKLTYVPVTFLSRGSMVMVTSTTVPAVLENR